MATSINDPANTAASMIITAGPAVQALIWKRTLQKFEFDLDYFQQLEGGEDAIIETETDTAKGAGQFITFRSVADFFGPGVQGDTLMTDTGTFEEFRPHTWNLQVDTIRNGTSYNRRMVPFLGLGGEFLGSIPEKLGKWLGWIKSEKLMMMFRENLPAATNQTVINGKTFDALNSSDYVSFNSLISAKATLSRQGGMEAKITKDMQGNMIKGWLYASITDAIWSLKLDQIYIDAVRSTKVETAADTRFKGGYPLIEGVMVRELPVVDHDGFGPIGSPWNPKAILGQAVTASSTSFLLYGGGSAVAAGLSYVDYFRYFKNNAYQFNPENIITPDNNLHYLLIINPPDGSVNQNKIGFYSYTTVPGNSQVNSGVNILINGQCAPANNGIQQTTLGSVTWNSGNFAPSAAGASPYFPGMTTTHPIGALVLQANAKGQPVGWSCMMGKRAANRGYGEDRARRSDSGNAIEGGFVKQVFIESIFGQAPRQDNVGRTPGALLVAHAINYAGVPIPTIV